MAPSRQHRRGIGQAGRSEDEVETDFCRVVTVGTIDFGYISICRFGKSDVCAL